MLSVSVIGVEIIDIKTAEALLILNRDMYLEKLVDGTGVNCDEGLDYKVKESYETLWDSSVLIQHELNYNKENERSNIKHQVCFDRIKIMVSVVLPHQTWR